MSYPERHHKLDRSNHSIAKGIVADRNREMKKVKTILVPHPTVPKTWIEKIVGNYKPE